MSEHWHWRRHHESVTSDRQFASAQFRDKTVVASACGRLVDYQEAVGDPTEATCPECQEIAFYLGDDDYDPDDCRPQKSGV